MSSANAQKSAEETENKGFSFCTLRKLDLRVRWHVEVSLSDILSDSVGIGEADCGAAIRCGERGRRGEGEGPVRLALSRSLRARILCRMLDCELRDILEILLAVTYWQND